MIKVLSLFGTRPEAIKMVNIIQKLADHKAKIRSVVCVTAQHREMLDQVLSLFGVHPDYDLDLMRRNQSLAQFTASAITELDKVIACEKPDYLLVQGDTTTTMTAALIGFYHKIKIAHVEAGLRTHDKYSPFPEEVNRRVTDVLSNLFFVPTGIARQNLVSEGVPDDQICITGNTGIDALLWAAAQPYQWNQGPMKTVPYDKRLVLITAHRRESFGGGLHNLCLAIRDLATRYKEDCHFIYPVHPNPNVQPTLRTKPRGLHDSNNLFSSS